MSAIATYREVSGLEPRNIELFPDRIQIVGKVTFGERFETVITRSKSFCRFRARSTSGRKISGSFFVLRLSHSFCF